MTLNELAALVHAEYGTYPIGAPVSHRWVMDLASYKEVRALCAAAGAIYPEGNDPKDWVPHPEDLLMGLPVEVREDGGTPHIAKR